MNKLTTMIFAVTPVFVGLLSPPLYGTAFAQDDGKAGFRWEAKINMQPTSPIMSAPKMRIAPAQAESAAPMPLMSSGASVEQGDGQLTLAGQADPEQMRASLFNPDVPGLNLLGGPVAMTIHLPADGKQVTLELEARLNTGYLWEVVDEESALYKQAGESKFAMRQDEIGSSSLETIQLEASPSPAAAREPVVHLVYHRPFEQDAPPIATVEIWMDGSANVINLSNPNPTASFAEADAAGGIVEENLNAMVEEKAAAGVVAAPPPPSWDWRDKGIVPDVRDQGACDSSWAFGTVGAMESAIAKKDGALVDLSEQFLISCNKDGWGCNGGRTATKYHYTTLANNQTTVGAVLEADKPYVADNDTCSEAYTHPYKASMWGFVTGLQWNMPTVAQLKRAIYNYGPVTAYVCVDSGWEFYKGGVYAPTSNECTGAKKVSHQVVLVGWDDTTSSWILRNSWGPEWGEGGYMRIAWDTNGTTSRIGEGASWVKYTPPAKPKISFKVASSTLAENAGSGPFPTITLSKPLDRYVVVHLTISGTASGEEYYMPHQTTFLSFAPGKTEASGIIHLADDALYEGDETIIYTIDKVVDASRPEDVIDIEKGPIPAHTVTIKDNDTKPKVNFSAASQNVLETAGSTQVTATLSAPAGVDVVIPYTVSGTATGGGVDHGLASSGTTFISAGKTSGAVVFGITNDKLYEKDETVILTMGEVKNAEKGTVPVHTVTIKDDESKPCVTLTPGTLLSPGELTVQENVGKVNITAELSQPAGVDIEVPITTRPTSAQSGVDYILSPTQLVIRAGEKKVTAPILTIVNDELYEEDETATLATPGCTVPQGGMMESFQKVIIKNDDPKPAVGFNPTAQTVLESVGKVNVTAVLSKPAGTAITVPYTIESGGTTATGGGVDHDLSNGSIVIPAGKTSGAVTFNVTNDTMDEDDEKIMLATFSDAAKAITSYHTVIVKDDDAAPKVAFASASQSVGENAGTVTVTAALSVESGRNITVPFSVSGTATGGGVDHNLGNGSISIPAGQKAGAATFTVTNDALYEDSETVVVTMGAPTNADKGAVTLHTVTIKDDDPKPQVNFSPGSQAVLENAGAIKVIATLSAPAAMDVVVPYTVGGTALGNGVDHGLLPMGSIRIPAGQKTGTITFTVINDVLYEESETVIVTMGAVTNADKGTVTVHTVTIKDDDPKPAVGFNPRSQKVLESVGKVNVTAVLSTPAGTDITVPYTIESGSTTATGGGVDHNLSNGSIIIPAGKTSGKVSFSVIDDKIDEDAENIVLVMSPDGANRIAPYHTVIIEDNDATPQVSFTSAGQSVGENVGTVTVTAALSAISGHEVTVPFSVGGTATGGGSDHSLSSEGSIIIPAGQKAGTVKFNVNNDTVNEANETVIITMGAVKNAVKGSMVVHTVTINDDDPTPTVNFSAKSQGVPEDFGTVTVTANLSAAAGMNVAVPYTVSGTATNGVDYKLSTSSILIPAGKTSGTVTFNLNKDTTPESNETIVFTMGKVTNAIKGQVAVHTVIIQDDDITVALINGDFEKGMTGWTYHGNVGAGVDDLFRNAGGIGSFKTGRSAVDFGGGSDTQGTGVLTQDVNTIANEAYKLSFDYGRFMYGNNAPQSIKVEVINLADNKILMSEVVTDASGQANLGLIFDNYSYLFKATGSKTRLSFRDVSGPSVDTDGLLDNVNIERAVRLGW